MIEILIENKAKILEVGKFEEDRFEAFLSDLNRAENQRFEILKKIKDLGEINLELIGKELNLSQKDLLLDIEYLKELGLLEDFNQISEFYKGIEKKNEKKGLFPNVLVIKEKKLCSGCGLCVSICPLNAIKFSDEELLIDEDVCINCGLCYACCHRSFFPKELNEYEIDRKENIQYHKGINYYKDILTAQTNDIEIKNIAQDGGVVTTLFKEALEEKIIDGALVVGNFSNSSFLKPMPMLIENERTLLKSCGTKYSNAHLLTILHEAKKYKKLGIVGTPCVLQALKKISYYPLNKPFFDNISLKIGVFCMESFDYNKTISIIKNEFKLNPKNVKKMDINRGRFIIYDKKGKSSDISLKKIRKYGRYGCFACSDLTAQFSDISVGSIGSNPKWSTVIIRNEKGENLFLKTLESKHLIKKEILEKDQDILKRIASSKFKMYQEIPRQQMIQQEPYIRNKNFKEVPLGLTREMVKLETKRCLQCGKPLCMEGCPVNVNIPEFIKLLKQENFHEALRNITHYNILPAICGRVCPQETQCEGYCLLGNIDKPVAIGYLERFIADWGTKNIQKEPLDSDKRNNIKVAIVGSGPAGLTCAGELARYGYDVTIFEALHTGGGVLAYGIPEFRLPKKIVKQEIETLKRMGVKMKYNMIIGKILSIQDLRDMGYKAFFIGVGAGLPVFLNIEGINLKGVLSANEFLTRVNLMKAYKFPKYDTPVEIGKNVVVIGGGNVAMDSARVAIRLGAEKVRLIYRRSEKEMPARREEYHHAIEEGIEFTFLINPVKLISDELGNIKEIEVIKMKLGEIDKSGRRKPIPIQDSEFRIKADMLIVAVGTKANPICPKSISGLEINEWGYIPTNYECQSNIDDIFAGGDIVTGNATVISAMGAGKRAAIAIHQLLTNKFKIRSSIEEKLTI